MATKLYSYWRSTAAYRVRLALNIKGLDYDIVPVALTPGVSEQRGDAYREMNPQMLVPFFDDGTVAIGQSQAILEYLEEAYPETPLLPESRQQRAAVRSFCNLICCDIHPLNNLRVLQYLQGPLAIDEQQLSTWYAHWVSEGFRAAEIIAAESAGKGPYVFGEKLSLADTCLIPQVFNARRFKVPLGPFPRLVAIADHCNTSGPFKDAAPENQPDFPGEGA